MRSTLANRSVTAATVAAHLNKAISVARDISLTASNARALALRAGSGAAGFRALTDFIDQLAKDSVTACRSINAQALVMSRCASEVARSQLALQKFQQAEVRAAGADYLTSIFPIRQRLSEENERRGQEFNRLIINLREALLELLRNMRTSSVLAAMSRIEATTSGEDYEQSLNVIADNVAASAEEIKQFVREAVSQFTGMQASS